MNNDNIESLKELLNKLHDHWGDALWIDASDLVTLERTIGYLDKTEGEAPQAEPVKPWREAFRAQYPNYPQVDLPWETKFNWAEREIAQLRAAPAAQHAESGAQESGLTTVPCPCCGEGSIVGCDECDGQGRVIVDKRDLADHLAAQVSANAEGAQGK